MTDANVTTVTITVDAAPVELITPGGWSLAQPVPGSYPVQRATLTQYEAIIPVRDEGGAPSGAYSFSLFPATSTANPEETDEGIP